MPSSLYTSLLLQDDKSVSVNDSVLSRSTSPSPPKLPGTKTVRNCNHRLRFFFISLLLFIFLLFQLMVASFDYNPETDSPNPNPEMELSFKKGDQITVLGKMVSI